MTIHITALLATGLTKQEAYEECAGALLALAAAFVRQDEIKMTLSDWSAFSEGAFAKAASLGELHEKIRSASLTPTSSEIH